jgi:outer membrane lipoprotein SlyB
MISYWGVDHGDDVVSKADKEYSPWKSYKSQGIRFKDRKTSVEGQKRYMKNYYSKDSAKRIGAHIGTGAALGGTAGAVLGRGRGAAIGAGAGSYVGTISGATGAGNRARVKTHREMTAEGKIVRDSKSAITYLGGNKKRGY